MLPDQRGVTGNGRLRDHAYAQALCRKQKIADIETAIEDTIRTQLALRSHDKHVRCTEEAKILDRLLTRRDASPKADSDAFI